MRKHKLKVEKRTILGKKVKVLRKEGILPANIYGKDIKSIAVQVPYKDFENVFKTAGETGLVDVEIDGQVKPSLIHNVQINHYKNTILHADFYSVDLKQKVSTMVPLEVIGTAKAVSDKIGLLEEPISEIEVEALPTDLPENIEVNVEHLAAVDQQITVADLKVPAGVTILTDKDQVVAKIGELVSKQAQAQAAAEQAAAQQAKAAAPTAAPEGAKAEAPEEAAKPTSDVAKAATEAKTEKKPAEDPPLRHGDGRQAKPTSKSAKDQQKP